MTADTEFESRLTMMLHDRAEAALNSAGFGASLPTGPDRHRSHGMSIAVLAMAAATAAGLIAISARAGDTGLASTTTLDGQQTSVSVEDATSESSITLQKASDWLNRQCVVLRQHLVPDRMTSRDAAAICASEVGMGSLSQFGFLAATGPGDNISNWLSTTPEALADCLNQAAVTPSIVPSTEPAILDVPAGAPSDAIEACWKYTLIELRLIDANVGTPPTDSPTLTTTLAALPDVTPEQQSATTTTVG